MTNRDSVSTRCFQYRLDDEGIIRAVCVVEHARLELEDAIAALEAIAEVGQGAKRPILADVRNVQYGSRENRLHYAARMDQYLLAAAAIVHTLPNRVFYDFFIQVNKPSVPTRLFTSEAEALAWLRQFANAAQES